MNILWWWPFGKVPEITAEQLYAELLDERSAPVILDVRTVTEWNDHRISGSINIPVTELSRRIPSLTLDRNQSVVAVCRSARRSIPAVRLLKRKGYVRVCQLQGGMLAWSGAGLPVELGAPSQVSAAGN